MSFTDKSAYLRAIFFVLPLGLGLMIISLKIYFTPAEKLEDFEYLQGDCSVKVDEHFDVITKKDREAFIFKFKNKNCFLYIFMVDDSLKNDIKEIYNAEVWIDEKSEIWQLKSNGKMIIKYEVHEIWLLFVALFGLITTAIAIGHIIIHRTDFFGGKSKPIPFLGSKKWNW